MEGTAFTEVHTFPTAVYTGRGRLEDAKTVNVFLKKPLFFPLSLSLSPRGPLLYVSAARCQDPILPHPAEAEVHSIKQQSVDLCGEIFPTLDFPVFPSPLQRQQARHVRARH